jgi:uncharacterized protein (DUF2062 family)
MGGLKLRLQRYVQRIRGELHDALAEEHTPNQVAYSFAIGVFITALPTLGTGVLVFFLIAYLFANISRIALFASVLVLNPVVKWGVYGSSFWMGSRLLGPVESMTVEEVSLSAAPEVVVRLVTGNVILAVAFTVIAYIAAYRLTLEYRRHRGETGALEERLAGLTDRFDR